jgi:hypothetical protein
MDLRKRIARVSRALHLHADQFLESPCADAHVSALAPLLVRLAAGSAASSSPRASRWDSSESPPIRVPAARSRTTCIPHARRQNRHVRRISTHHHFVLDRAAPACGRVLARASRLARRDNQTFATNEHCIKREISA